MPRRVLVTGGSGFVGQWTARALLENGCAVFAGTPHDSPRTHVLSDRERAAVCWIRMDMCSPDQIRQGLETSSPDWILHLAGIAFPPDADQASVRAYDVNAMGAARLFAALTSLGAVTSIRVLVVGSAQQYGRHEESEYPIKESAAQRPATVYSASKAAQEIIALQFFRETGLPIICTRSFNHTGPGHGGGYLLPSLVRRVLELPDRGGKLRIGNGEARRDFLHVTDAVDAYLSLLDRGRPGEAYNVCSGQAASVREIATRVLRASGRDAEVVEDATLVRSADMPLLHGDNTKLRRDTGWAPRHSLDDIIADLIDATTR